jgi:hypothetical protein
LLQPLVALLPALLHLVPTEAVGRRAKRMALQAAIGIVAAALGMIALGFGLAAAYLELTTVVTPAASAGIVAGALAFLAAVAALVAARVGKSEQPKRARRADDRASDNGDAGPVQQLTRLIEAKPVESALVAAAIGAVVGWLDRRR